MMHFLNVTDVLTNKVNCSGSTFNLILKSCARLARPIALPTLTLVFCVLQIKGTVGNTAVFSGGWCNNFTYD